MEVHFSVGEMAQLAEIAAHKGIDTERLVKEAALKLLQDDADFRAAVQRGLDQADRGEFVEEEEMNARVEQMLKRYHDSLDPGGGDRPGPDQQLPAGTASRSRSNDNFETLRRGHFAKAHAESWSTRA